MSDCHVSPCPTASRVSYLPLVLLCKHSSCTVFSSRAVTISHVLHSRLPVLKSLCPASWSPEPTLSHRQAAFQTARSHQAQPAYSLLAFAVPLVQKRHQSLQSPQVKADSERTKSLWFYFKTISAASQATAALHLVGEFMKERNERRPL